MRIKGKNQHVIPNDTGWYVVDEASQKVVQHFSSQTEALEYARRCASCNEGEVLVHTTPCTDLENLSTVSLPQREYFPGSGYVDMNPGASPRHESRTSGQAPGRFGDVPDNEDYYYDL